MSDNKHRCEWGREPEIYRSYHDEEWGVPLHDDQQLFEFLILEGMQAGLSWLTILKKRDNFRAAFDNFDPHKVARYDDAKIEALMQDAGIIRNRQKINAAVGNARAFLAVVDEFGSFDAYNWSFVDGKPVQNTWRTMSDIPASTPISEAMSKDLKRRGFKFVGPTIVYAHMQATGMVNDHVMDCFRYNEVKRLAGSIQPAIRPL